MTALLLASALLLGQYDHRRPHHRDPAPIPAAPEPISWRAGDLAIVIVPGPPDKIGARVRLIRQAYAHWLVEATDGTGIRYDVTIAALSRPVPSVAPAPDVAPVFPSPQAIATPEVAVPAPVVTYAYTPAPAPPACYAPPRHRAFRRARHGCR